MSRGGLSRAPLGEYRLAAGSSGLSREEVEENQRWRLTVAAVQVFAERGYQRTRSGDVARRAHVSAATFYQYFENIDDCLLAAYEMAAACLSDVVGGACDRHADGAWPQRLSVAVGEALGFLADEPAVARLLGAEALAGTPAIADARERLLAQLAERLEEGRSQLHGRPDRLPPETELLLLEGAFVSVTESPPDDLPGLAFELTQILAVPYLARPAGL